MGKKLWCPTAVEGGPSLTSGGAENIKYAAKKGLSALGKSCPALYSIFPRGGSQSSRAIVAVYLWAPQRTPAHSDWWLLTGDTQKGLETCQDTCSE